LLPFLDVVGLHEMPKTIRCELYGSDASATMQAH
jgi:hypothetical protein